MALDILSYLTQRPDAQDTLDGVVQWWWLTQPERPRHPHEVRAAIGELMAAGFIVAARGGDRQERYRLNPARRQAAQVVVDACRGKKDC